MIPRLEVMGLSPVMLSEGYPPEKKVFHLLTVIDSDASMLACALDGEEVQGLRDYLDRYLEGKLT